MVSAHSSFKFSVYLVFHDFCGDSSILSFMYRFKDGEEIKPNNERIKTTAAPDGTLKLSIDRVDATDSGAYKAVAVNDLGKSIANTAVVVESKWIREEHLKVCNQGISELNQA